MDITMIVLMKLSGMSIVSALIPLLIQTKMRIAMELWMHVINVLGSMIITMMMVILFQMGVMRVQDLMI
jgi:hypothetical protein